LILTFPIAGQQTGEDKDQQLFEQINQYRVERDLSVLQREAALERAARTYSRVLMEQGFLSHHIPRESSPMSRYREEGGTALEVGEILGTISNEKGWSQLLQLWLESPEHKAVLSAPQWHSMGLHLYETENKRVAVVMFSISLLAEEKEPGQWISSWPGIRYRLSPDGILSPPLQEGFISLDLLHKHLDSYTLLEITDSQGKVHNRFMLSPAGHDVNAEWLE